ncbi:MAG: TonB-dependent receptor [Bacteroidia bacterium]
MKYLPIILSFCFGLGTLTLSAQNLSLSGKITDQETGQALTAATISVPTDNIGAFSADDGSYQLNIPLRGRTSVTVRYTYNGYTPIEQTVSLTEGNTATLDIALIPAGFTTDDVVITATKGFEQKQSDVTVSIQVVKPQSIDLQATTQMDKIIDQIPGVDNQDGQINIRGSSGYAYGVGSRVMVTLDGLPLLTGDAGTASLKLIPVDNIAQVEVLKGASSVLYGSAALGGVINVITADPEAIPKTRVRVRGGLFGQPANSALDWDGDASAYEASAHIFHSRKINKNTDLTFQTDFIKDSGYRLGTDREQFRGIVMTKFRPEKIPGLTIGLNATTNIDSSGSILYWASYSPYALQGANGEDSITVGGALTPTTDNGGFRKQLTTLFAVDPSIKYLTKNGDLFWYRGRMLRNSSQNNTNQSSTNYIFYNDLIYQTTLFDKVSWIVGGTYSYSIANGDSLYGGRHDGDAEGIYTQFDAKFGKLNTSFGFRYQSVRIDTLERESRPVLRAGLNYELRKGSNVRASFGQAFRVPTVAERYAATAGGAILIDPNPNIQSEYGYSTELAFRQGYKGKGVKSKFLGYLDIAAFVMDYQNMVEFGINEVEFISRPDGSLGFQGRFSSKNVANARISGLEITTLNSFEWKNGFFLNISGGVTLTNPVDLNAVPEEQQMDFSEFNSRGDLFDFLAFTRVVNQIADTTTFDQPQTLKYRSRTLIRASGSVGYKGLALTANYRKKSVVESIDQFLYLVVADLSDFRAANPDGFDVLDLIASYDFGRGQVSVTVDNVFNEEYMVVPGLLAAQRKATLQLMLRF